MAKTVSLETLSCKAINTNSKASHEGYDKGWLTDREAVAFLPRPLKTHQVLEELKMDEQKIREAAYRLWEKQGKPQGQDLEHWFTAENSGGEESSEENSDNSTSDSASSGEDPRVKRENGKKRTTKANRLG